MDTNSTALTNCSAGSNSTSNSETEAGADSESQSHGEGTSTSDAKAVVPKDCDDAEECEELKPPCKGKKGKRNII